MCRCYTGAGSGWQAGRLQSFPTLAAPGTGDEAPATSEACPWGQVTSHRHAGSTTSQRLGARQAGVSYLNKCEAPHVLLVRAGCVPHCCNQWEAAPEAGALALNAGQACRYPLDDLYRSSPRSRCELATGLMRQKFCSEELCLYHSDWSRRT